MRRPATRRSRAQRQYDAADPENRLVADELERRWNQALERVREIEQRIAQHAAHAAGAARTDAGGVRSAGRAAGGALAAPDDADARLKKRIVRSLIQEVIVDVDSVSERDRAGDPLEGRRPHRAARAAATPRPEQHAHRTGDAWMRSAPWPGSAPTP